MSSVHIFFYSKGNESIKELNLSHNKFREEGGKQIGLSLGMYAFASPLPPASEGWGKVMFSLVSVCLSTPPAGQATYAAGGMPLAFSQEDFLVTQVFWTKGLREM